MNRVRNILITIILLSIPGFSQAQDIYIHPSQVDTSIGTSFTVDIMVGNITDLSTFEFRILFDKDILEAVSIARGPLWSDSNYLWRAGEIDNTSGIISFISGAASSGSRPVGDSVDNDGGVLATITFQAIAAGTSPVNLIDVLMYYVNGGIISISVANGNVKVESTGTFVFDLFRGWNMLSCPGDPAITDIPTLVGDTPLVPYAYKWNPDTLAYELVDTFEFATCYWFGSTQDIQFPIDYQPRDILTCQVKGGWNMVGGVSGSVPVSNITSDPPGVVLPYVYCWNTNTLVYDLVNNIEPGHGYWVGSTADATLTIDSSLPPAAPPAQIQTDVSPIIPSWKSVITVQTQNQRQDLVFGLHPSASRGFDRLMDRPSPPLPAGMNNGLRAGWILENPHFPLLNESFVGNNSHASWEISIELPESGELQWKRLPTAYRCLLWYDGQVIQMQHEKSINLPAGKHSLRLILDAFDALPKQTQLLANYPNPFNPETWIPYRLAQDSNVTVLIYDTSGREVRRFHLHNQLAGEYKDKERAVYWDGKNQAGESVSSGVYFYSMQAIGTSQTRKLVIIR